MSGLGPDIPSSCLDHIQENKAWPKKGKDKNKDKTFTLLLFIPLNYKGQAGERRKAERQQKLLTGG